MATIAFRAYLVGGPAVDVSYDGPEHVDAARVMEHVVATLARETGVVHCRQGDQSVVLFARGVAAVEMVHSGHTPTRKGPDDMDPA